LFTSAVQKTGDKQNAERERKHAVGLEEFMA
jgi:hypothetical protein